jgi:glycosyltransferase involved in cell wall biosynthesis
MDCPNADLICQSAPLRLSVIIPAYNAAATLSRTLESLQHISPTNRASVQIILVNDGSSDATPALIRGFVDQRKFPHVIHIDQPNGGSATARNAGLRAATGKWIFFLDADDELAFDPMPYVGRWNDSATCLAFPVLLCRGRFRFWWRALRLTPESHLDVLTATCAFYPSNLFFRADCVSSPLQTRYRYGEDWHFWLSNPAIFQRMRVFSAISAIIHVHGNNKSSQFEVRGRYRTMLADEFLEAHARGLTVKQRNNLLVQSRIGQLQLGRRIPLSTFYQLPCDAVLYLKLIIYGVLKRNLARLELYRPKHGQRRKDFRSAPS